MQNENYFGEVIYSYTRSQAIEDGVLVDIDALNLDDKTTGLSLRKEAGIKWPIAMTSTLFGEINPTLKEIGDGQSLTGRLWDLFNIFRFASKQGGRELVSHFIVRKYKTKIVNGKEVLYPAPVKVEFKVVSGPGDQGEPVLTFMLPNED